MYDRTSHAAVRCRAAAVWTVATTLLAGLVRLAGGEVRALAGTPALDFTALLVQVCAVVLLGSGLWLWLLTTHVALAVLRAPGSGVRGRGAVRGLLLLACGVAALGSATPAAAAPGAPVAPPLPAQALHGLPLPDRPTAEQARTAAPDTDTPRGALVTVRPGDSLWAIAQRHLGPAADTADVASYWPRIHAHNQAVVGPDPDLVQPGQRLGLPPTDRT